MDVYSRLSGHALLLPLQNHFQSHFQRKKNKRDASVYLDFGHDLRPCFFSVLLGFRFDQTLITKA